MLKFINRSSLKLVLARLKRNLNTYNGLLKISEEVQSAIEEGLPIVALESTLITHGMPYPQNFKIAEEIDGAIREIGAIPATVALKGGKMCVGLTKEEVQELAEQNEAAMKISRRDISYALNKGLLGGATVSTTMIASHRVGIPIFITGGIGGVHRGGESSFDISADLMELGRTPVTVISAGVKSLLDIGRTLEYLETMGVCVATFGSTKDFPAFFVPDSGFHAPFSINNITEAAQLIDTHQKFGLQSGILLAIPIPEESAAEGIGIEAAIQRALREAHEAGLRGRDITPFCLKRINELSLGKSLQSNIALYKNNAKIGSQIAVELAQLKKSTATRGNQGRPVVIGATIVDCITRIDEDVPKIVHYIEPEEICTDGMRKVSDALPKLRETRSMESQNSTPVLMLDGGTHAGSIRLSLGGVGRNLADVLSRCGKYPLFISATGQDQLKDFVWQQTRNMSPEGTITVPGETTSTCCAIHDKQGELLYIIMDTKIHNEITPNHVAKFLPILEKAPLVAIDANIPFKTMEFICELCAKSNIPVWYEPTDITIATKIFKSDLWKTLTYISPNLPEFNTIIGKITSSNIYDKVLTFENELKEDTLQKIADLSRNLVRHIHCVIISLGKHGVLVCRNGEPNELFPVHRKIIRKSTSFSAMYYPSIPQQIVSVTGAGDSLSGVIMASMMNHLPPDLCIKAGIIAANFTLQHYATISPNLGKDLLDEKIINFHYLLQTVRVY